MGKIYAVEYKLLNTLTFQHIIPSPQELAALEDMKVNKERKLTPIEQKLFRESRLDKRFIPGINLITEEELEFLLGHPDFEPLFGEIPGRNGTVQPQALEWVRNRGPEDFKGEIKEGESILSGLKDKEALKIVKTTLDKDLLLRWQRQEKREEILKAVEGQLFKLKPGQKAA